MQKSISYVRGTCASSVGITPVKRFVHMAQVPVSVDRNPSCDGIERVSLFVDRKSDEESPVSLPSCVGMAPVSRLLDSCTADTIVRCAISVGIVPCPRIQYFC
jgi:hypothetical protein